MSSYDGVMSSINHTVNGKPKTHVRVYAAPYTVNTVFKDP